MMHNRPKLKLTRPIEPDLNTSQRVRAVRIKSSAELEEEMLANMPKFKARPLNKKIMESPSLPLLPRTTTQPFKFQEFHLKTMERVNQHSETTSIISPDTLSQDHQKPLKLTEPKPPCLQTSLRARPPTIKPLKLTELKPPCLQTSLRARPSTIKPLKLTELKPPCLQTSLRARPPTIKPSTELEIEELEKIPKFKAQPLNKKLSLHSDSSSQFGKHEVPRITTPNPFNLRTEERGLEKERQFTVQILQKQIEEEKARIPKAAPYPYTTDYPVVPPKPEPKPCTEPEGFQLESLIRHEEELRRKMEERERMEREEARRRLFKAQPILHEDPIPLPKRERRPLTNVQEFNLHVDHRAVERSEFDKKIKEKEMVYKRHREENENMKKIEEEKELKQMRREMVPHARPIPKFNNPFVPQKSMKDLTRAKSPVLRVKQREERRRHALR